MQITSGLPEGFNAGAYDMMIVFGAKGPGLFAPISLALDEELASLPRDANLAQHLGNSG